MDHHSPEPISARISRSGKDFVTIVWPVIGPLMGGGKIIPVETVTQDAMAKHLDVYAGIDAWQILGDNSVRGVASRVRYGKNWSDFTVRARLRNGGDTEWQKRLLAVTHPHLGLLTPQWTVTAYLDQSGGSVTSVAAVKTESLIRYILAHMKQMQMRVAPTGEGFYAVSFNSLKRWGADVVITDGNGGGQTSLEVA